MNDNINKYQNILGVLLVFTGAVMFSAKAIMVKVIYKENVDAITSLMLRMMYAAPLYVGVIFYHRKKLLSLTLPIRDYINIVIMGIVGYYLASIFDFAGLQYVTASTERLILFAYPTLVVLISAFYLKKKIKKVEKLALALTYGGIAFVFGNEFSTDQTDFVLGAVLIFASALTYAMFLVGSGELIPKLGVQLFTSLAIFISAIAVLVHYVLVYPIQNIADVSLNVHLISMMMAVFSTFIPSFLISGGISKVGSSSASIVASVGPVSTIILANIFLDEIFTGVQLVGTVLVLSGVVLVGLNKKEK